MSFVVDPHTGRLALNLASVGRRPPGERLDEALLLEIGRRAFDHPPPERIPYDWEQPMAAVVERVRRRMRKALADGGPRALKSYDPALELEVGWRALMMLSSKAAWKRWFLTVLDLWKLEPRRQRKLREQERERRRDRRQYDERRRGVTEREWGRLRRGVLSAEPRCRLCGGRATQVDHVVPVWRGGKTEPGNLQPLCRRCHEEKSAREQAHLYDGLRLAFAAVRAGRRRDSRG